MKLHRTLTEAERSVLASLLASIAQTLEQLEASEEHASSLSLSLAKVQTERAELAAAVDGTKRKEVAALGVIREQEELLSQTAGRADGRRERAVRELASLRRRAEAAIAALCGERFHRLLSGWAVEHFGRFYTNADELEAAVKNLPVHREFHAFLKPNLGGDEAGTLEALGRHAQTLHAFLTGGHFWSFQGLTGDPL